MAEKNTTMTNQYLSFALRDEHFAVEIYKVREVLDVTTLTRIPRMPSYMCGVINLRGSVVPVIDLGLKLGMPSYKQSVNTCIMIVEVKVEGEQQPVQIGLLTDSVQEVINLSSDQIEPAPKLGVDIQAEFIRGMGRQGEKFLILLNIDVILASEEAGILDHLNTTGSKEKTAVNA